MNNQKWIFHLVSYGKNYMEKEQKEHVECMVLGRYLSSQLEIYSSVNKHSDTYCVQISASNPKKILRDRVRDKETER